MTLSMLQSNCEESRPAPSSYRLDWWERHKDIVHIDTGARISKSARGNRLLTASRPASHHSSLRQMILEVDQRAIDSCLLPSTKPNFLFCPSISLVLDEEFEVLLEDDSALCSESLDDVAIAALGQSVFDQLQRRVDVIAHRIGVHGT
jgi:hypothetical protein